MRNINNREIEEYQLSKFDLRDKISIKPEYQIQATYHSCWAYAGLNSIETYIALNYGKEYNFSEAHVEYMTSNELGGKRKLNTSGRFGDVVEYVKQKQGPVLENKIPNRVYKKDEYELLKNANKKPIIKGIGAIYFNESSSLFREDIKKHIVKNGSITAEIYFNPNDKNYYNDSTQAYSNLYVGQVSHMISIIGWDDNYSKENFPISNRPKNDGAYIAMSFWKQIPNDHIIYISYEDRLVENYMAGIVSCTMY